MAGWQVVAAVAAVIGAVTGGLNLWLHWHGLKAERRERSARATIEIGTAEVAEGWHVSTLRVRNNGSLPLRVRSLTVRKPRGLWLAQNVKDALGLAAAGPSIAVDWEVRAGVVDGKAWSFRTSFACGIPRPSGGGSTASEMSTTVACIRMTAEEISESRRPITIDITTNAVAFTKAAAIDASAIPAPVTRPSRFPRLRRSRYLDG